MLTSPVSIPPVGGSTTMTFSAFACRSISKGSLGS